MTTGSYYAGTLKGSDLYGALVISNATWDQIAELCNRFGLSPQTIIDLAIRKLQNEANSYGSLQAWAPEKPKEPSTPLGGDNHAQVKARGARRG